MPSASVNGQPGPFATNVASSVASTSAVANEDPVFDSIDSAIEALRRNEFVIVLDSEDRENEGDLILPAANITTEQMAFLIRYTSGFVCISLHPERIAELSLPMMFPQNEEPHKTAYTVTADYRHGTTTGISAHDRALTARMLSSGSGATSKDFSRPGHLCPLRYTEGGVQVRMGHTEASIDLSVAAGFPPAALLCELVDSNSPQGSIASRDACFKFAKTHGLKVVTIEALKAWQKTAKASANGSATVLKQAATDEARGIKIDEQRVVGSTV